jgi:hypothetical protein
MPRAAGDHAYKTGEDRKELKSKVYQEKHAGGKEEKMGRPV